MEVVDGEDEVENNGDYVFGMSVMYFCNPGYALMGSSEVFKCMPDGHWSPRQLPVCRKINDGKRQFSFYISYWMHSQNRVKMGYLISYFRRS